MSRYIPQINNQNFVYPNFDLAEYDVDIIHVPNDNSVSGVVTSFSATTVSSSSITVRTTNTWTRNGAEGFILNNGAIRIYTLHAMVPGQLFYKPWVIIGSNSTLSTGVTTLTSTNRDALFTPDQFGLASFTSGTYYFEFRFVGATAIFPVCETLSITIP
jgi:hypothetical protein